MKDPKRLRQAGSDRLATLLLEAGRSEAPSKARLGRMLGGMAGAGAALAATAAAATAPAVQSAIPIALVIKWLGLGVFAGVVASAGAGAVLPARPSGGHENVAVSDRPHGEVATVRAPRADPSHPAGLEQPAKPPELAASAVLPAASGAPQRVHQQKPSHKVAALEERRSTTTTGAASESTPATGAPEAQALREEVTTLGRAKAALNRGSSAEALAIVRGYHARFPQGRLGPEAAYLEMEAELANGNPSRARELAGGLARGASPNAERARVILRDPTPP